MTIENYKKLLEAHNWNYIISHNPKEVELGHIERNNLLRIASESGELRRAYFEYKEKIIPPGR